MRYLGEEVERLDAQLAALARAETAMRLRLGQVLEVLSRGGHFELGFSSLAAYALERCDRSVRWVESARCLARRVEMLPEIRRAMAVGKVSWSMGELLARVAQPHDEARWIEAAESRTVRQMRQLVMGAAVEKREAGVAALQPKAVVSEPKAALFEQRAAVFEPRGGVFEPRGAVFEPQAGSSAPSARESGNGGHTSDDDEMCTLTCTVDQEEAWLVEATRVLLEQLGVHGSDAQSEALLAEGQCTLLAALPAGALDMGDGESSNSAQRHWLMQLDRWRAEAEALCEERIREAMLRSGKAEPAPVAVAVEVALGLVSLERTACVELDGSVRWLSQALARHELELSRLVLQLHRADGWRRLGYATETQYARERLGLSHSSMLARRSLALRLERLPRVAAALGAGHIGVEAALQVVRVATASTQADWVERARHRTIKHLREEVAAALTAVRLTGESECPPPTDSELDAFHELERAVVSGRASRPVPPTNDREVARGVGQQGVDVTRPMTAGSAPRRAWLGMLGSLAGWLESGLQSSAAGTKPAGSSRVASAGRVTLRLRVSRATYGWWRGLEARARRWLPCGMSWLRFLCLSVWQAWQHLIGTDVAYGQIYVRDRYRCMSPVCRRQDVTPHHLQFRSAGGSDADDNVASVCSWCHLEGVHGGRIRATGTAERIRWELGATGSPCVVVNGRERMAA